ncbi:MAG: sigma-70 family RNA polymerase sigma factor [Candidatus Eisenbacteria sp.]|nr:sigma-70 family RNA polymerase sigma factor [Candidatus Eisenbacteria bacterium]
MNEGSPPAAEDRDRPERDLIHVIVTRSGSDDAERACSTLLGRYRERVYLWCYRYTQNHDRALDLAQEVLLNAYRSLGTYEDRSRFGAWLFTIARNRCLSDLRRPALLIDDEVDPNGLPNPQGNPHQMLVEKKSEAELLDLIEEHLDPLERRALWLRCIERMPVDAITSLLMIEEASGARALLQRARRKLRAALQREGDGA